MSLVLLTSAFILPDSTAGAEFVSTPAAQSSEAVTPDESEFEYELLPVQNPTKASILFYSGSADKIIIPDTLGGYPVEIIDCTAFVGNDLLTYVRIPASVNQVIGNIFNMCLSLEKIEVDENNKYYKAVDGVLYGIDTEKNSPTYGEIKTLISFPAGRGGSFTVPYGVETIDVAAFDYCYNLTSIDMYNTVTKINDNAFSFCWGLESIRFSDNLRSLGSYALSHCDMLTSFYLPATLTVIGRDAFMGDYDSSGNKIYFFTNGVRCVKNSYAHKYLKAQALPDSIIIMDNRTITDIDTGITVIDHKNILPLDKNIDISSKPVDIAEVESLFPVRYNKAYAYDIELVCDGKTYNPVDNFIIRFDKLDKDVIPSATKLYKLTGTTAVPVNGTPSTPFVGTQTKTGGRFFILSNNDFSLKGDIDGDGKVTLFDARAALHAATGTLTLTPEQAAAANADDSTDKKITTVDARVILRYAAGILK